MATPRKPRTTPRPAPVEEAPVIEMPQAPPPPPIALITVVDQKGKTHDFRNVQFQITDQGVLAILKEDGGIKTCFADGCWTRLNCS